MTFWHSTKTHKPPTSGTYIVYQETTGYVLIADVEHFTDGSFQFTNDYEPEYLEGITHFAEIPPIPLPISQSQCYEHMFVVEKGLPPGTQIPKCVWCGEFPPAYKNKTSIEQV